MASSTESELSRDIRYWAFSWVLSIRVTGGRDSPYSRMYHYSFRWTGFTWSITFTDHQIETFIIKPHDTSATKSNCRVYWKGVLGADTCVVSRLAYLALLRSAASRPPSATAFTWATAAWITWGREQGKVNPLVNHTDRQWNTHNYNNLGIYVFSIDRFSHCILDPLMAGVDTHVSGRGSLGDGVHSKQTRVRVADIESRSLNRNSSI